MFQIGIVAGHSIDWQCWNCGRKWQFGLWGTVIEIAEETKAERKITSEEDFFFG
jgi:hypothetical protein